MTYIEFYDRTLIENICSSLTNPPERVILIGDKNRLLESQAEIYAGILRKRGFEVEFGYKSVNKNNLQNVIDVLSSIIEAYEDCVFDLTGGEDIYLVATGVVFERYRDKNIQMHRFNIRNNTIQDCDCDGKTIAETELPKLTVEENVRIYGGDIVYENMRPGTTTIWNFEGEFAKDVDVMWNICRGNVRLWNTQTEVFAEAEKLKATDSQGLTTSVSIPLLLECLKQREIDRVPHPVVINGLSRAGLINVQDDGKIFSVTYKSEQVRKCLTKAGQELEMKIYVSALRVCEKDGSHTYNDVMNGVYIDWDGDLHIGRECHDTENEIDVMMMHGMVPVFVSCKNGHMTIDELYKLDTVASRFGGKYARKVIVATALDEESDFTAHLRERADDMQIRIVPSPDGEKIQDMDDAGLQRIIRTFWNN